MLEADGEADGGTGRDRLRTMIVELAEVARRGLADSAERVAGFVDLLLDLRARARTD